MDLSTVFSDATVPSIKFCNSNALNIFSVESLILRYGSGLMSYCCHVNNGIVKHAATARQKF
jgi:hypothetical protein